MRYSAALFVLIFSLAMMSNCDVTNPAGEEEVDNMDLQMDSFWFFQHRDTLRADESILLYAILGPEFDIQTMEKSIEFTLSTDAGDEQKILEMGSFDDMSNRELAEIIRVHTAGNIHAGCCSSWGLTGVREADAERGVTTCENGREVVASDETIEAFGQWVEEKEGLKTGKEINVMFFIGFDHELITEELIGELRSHPNFWFLEPAEGVTFGKKEEASDGKATRHFSASENDCREARRAAGRLLFYEELEEIAGIEPGQTLTASFEQPDGEVLETSVYIGEPSDAE